MQISIELDNASCPVLVRSSSDTDANSNSEAGRDAKSNPEADAKAGRDAKPNPEADADELLHRHEWMAALTGTPAAGPSQLADHSLTRPFVTGRPIDQLADHETEQALISLVEFVALMAERGCTHGSLEADKVIATNAGIHVLDAGSCRIHETAEAQAVDVTALGQMIDELSPTDSHIRATWLDLSSHDSPSAAALAQRVGGPAIARPTTQPARWPRQAAMASVLAVAVIALALASRSAGGSNESPGEQAVADALSATDSPAATVTSPATDSLATDDLATEQLATDDLATDNLATDQLNGAPSTTTQPAPAQALWTEEPCDPANCAGNLSWADGVLTVEGVQYALGKPGDEVFFGRWYCATEPTPAVFTAAGSLYLFTDLKLPAVQTIVGPVASMTVEADVECDTLLATSADGASTRFPTITEPIQP